MNKKGFTIVEILGVIVVLAVIMALVIPNLTKSSSNAKERLYETKVEMIKKAAILYAQDNYTQLVGDNVGYSVTRRITSGLLIEEGYYVADKETSDGGVLVDPRTNEEMVLTIKLIFDTINKKITAEVVN